MMQLFTSPIFCILFLIIFFAGFLWGCDQAEKYWKRQFRIFSDTTNAEYRRCLTEIEDKYKGNRSISNYN